MTDIELILIYFPHLIPELIRMLIETDMPLLELLCDFENWEE